MTSKLRAILPEGYKKNSQCIEWVKKFYRYSALSGSRSSTGTPKPMGALDPGGSENPSEGSLDPTGIRAFSLDHAPP